MVDRDGNIVSLIQSVYLSFGSGVVVDGIRLPPAESRRALRARPGAARTRSRRASVPFHTIIPGFMEKDDIHIGFGIMGGLNQAQAHAQFVSNVIDGGMNIQAALEAPRFTKLEFGGCNVYMERRVSAEVRDKLTDMGHVI